MSGSMRRLLTLVAMVMGLQSAGVSAAEAGALAYSISARDNLLRVVDPSTAATVSGVPITLSGRTVLAGTGLARHPGTGELWALLVLGGQASRQLVRIDPASGVATAVGDTGGAFAGLAFDAAGTLFGVVGERQVGTTEPETLYILNTANGAPTKVCTLGRGADGEAIAFSSTDGRLYHSSGIVDVIFETVDLVSCATSDIPLAPIFVETQALAFWPGPDVFLWAASAALYRLRPDGGTAFVGSLDHLSKGLVVIGVAGGRDLTALGPAKVWIGLRNSDDIGLRLDLLAEVFVDEEKVGSGQLDNVLAGGSGFNNAVLRTIPLALLDGPVSLPQGAELQLRISARRTCSGGGHRSGTVRLWFDGALIDSGSRRDAGSRFEASIDDETDDYFLRDGFALSTGPGQSRRFIDATVNSAVPCANRSFTAFGMWSITPYPYYGTSLLGPVRPSYAVGALALVAALLLGQVRLGTRRR